MKLELEVPTWYSNDSMYSSKVKSTDALLESPCINLDSKQAPDLKPLQEVIDEFKGAIIPLLVEQTTKWFTAPLTVEQITKRLAFEFVQMSHTAEQRWVKALWKPSHFQVSRKVFRLVFQITALHECNPRIPLTFLEPLTPRATTPTEEETEQVRNIVLLPGAGPEDLEQVDDIPLSETLGSMELRDERMREKHRLRQAKLRAAIARLKVEEMRERYLRHYGDEYLNESSESEEDDSSLESEISDSVHKK